MHRIRHHISSIYSIQFNAKLNLQETTDRVYEREFGSTVAVEGFVQMLPLKQMHDAALTGSHEMTILR